ncbi:MAG: endonuclease III [Elusimicrobia bacterium]|nr:endonuclease III [Elusimicrobiota bacterium]MBP9699135.1 endonuclease III [Elusimicrobiota bacterium]
MAWDKLLDTLHKAYPRPQCALIHNGPFQLLIATILSAQCTDERVNQVTAVLFKKFPTPEKLGAAPLPDVEQVIRSTGFFHQKAKSIVLSSRCLVEQHGGQVPRDMEALLSLRGVARKTANVVLGTGFGVAAGIVVDTHVKRLARRLGLTRQIDPVKVERDLMKKIPKKDWVWFSHALIHHGRTVCTALRPRCGSCPVGNLCPSAGTV